MKNLKQALKELQEEKPGLWANIRAKREKGEKPSHGNSNAHKDAVAAGKKINKMSEEQGKFYVGYNLGRGQGKGIFKTPYDSYAEAKKEVEKSYQLDKGSRNMTAYYVADENGNLHKEVVDEILKIFNTQRVKEATKVSEANVNPEAEKLIGNFIMKLAKRYGYGAKDAIYLVQSVISNIEASGKLNEGEEWPEEVPSRHGDIIFKLIKVMPDRAKYALIDAKTGKEWEAGGRVFGSIKSLMASAEDTIMPQGGRQSTNLGEDKSDAVRWFGNVKYYYTKAFVELKGEDKQLYIQMLKDYFSKL